MKQESDAAKALRFHADRMYDESCKRLLAEKVFLAWIIKMAVDECQNMSIEEIMGCIEGKPQIGSVAVLPDETNTGRIRGSNAEDSTVTEGTVFYDIRFDLIIPRKKDNIQLIINVESQNNSHPGYPLTKRALYYCARLLSAQNGIEFKNSNYGELKKVYSIWLINRPAKKAENTVTEYTIQEKCRLGNSTVRKKDYDVLKVVFLYLGELNENQEVNALKLLDVIRSNTLSIQQKYTILEDEFKIEMTEDIDEEVHEMCNWSVGVREDAMEKGLKKGREEGIRLHMLKVFQNMLAMGMPFEKAAALAGAETEEEIQYLREHSQGGS